MGARIGVGAVAATVLLALVLAASLGKGKEYRVLFSNVSGADGAAIVAALQQMNVPYQFTEGGGAIMVPEEVVYETRLKLAGQGLPKSGNVGFELLENQKFGTSQFVERVNYLRGLEGELSRSIASIGQVKSARVHLAVPKQTAFVREQERPSASVLITLYPGRVLDPAQSAAIARLVSSSVPGMSPQDVSILDTEGASLMANQQRASDMDALQLKHTTELEALLAKRLAALLEPLAGKDGFRAQVTVDMNFDERERTAEVFSRNSPPNEQSIRSEQTVEAGPRGAGTGGIPGALTNQPQVPPEAPIVQDVANPRRNQARELNAPGPVETGVTVVDGEGQRRERTINYEVDRAIERFKASKGQIRRVSAAVILDNKANAGARSPYSPEEIQQITMLVRDAIGFVPARGDTVSVVNLPFSTMEGAVDKSLISADLLSQLLRYLAIAVAALFVWWALLRPFLRSRNKAQLPSAAGLTEPELDPRARLEREQREREEALVAQREAWQAEEQRRLADRKEEQQRMLENEVQRKQRYDELVAYLQQYVAQEPEKAALQLRAWAGEPQQHAGLQGAREMERA